MAGGIFVSQNKIRPGFYHKFRAAARDRDLFGDLGVAALALDLDWGKTGEIISIDTDAPQEEFMAKLGHNREGMLLVDECLKRAVTLKIWRTNGSGIKAALDMTPQPVIATATCPGTRGNDIEVQIVDDVDAPGTYIVYTYIDEMQVAEQRGVVVAEDIANNDWVGFAGTGPITGAAGGSLVGGTDSTATINDHNLFLEALEVQDFNAFGLCSDDTVLKPMYATAAKHYADDLGKLVQCIMPDYNAAYEAVTSLLNGVKLADGRVLDKTQAVAWYVGAAAAAGPSDSLTYAAYDGAVGPDVRFSDAQIKKAILGGHVVFELQKDDYGQDIAVVEQDRNTLIRYTKDRPKLWSKNRVVRAIFYLVNSLFRVWHLYYIGKVDNNETGRMLFKADLCKVMDNLVARGAFRDFDPERDIMVKQGKDIDSVVCCLDVWPVDAMEKMYFELIVH